MDVAIKAILIIGALVLLVILTVSLKRDEQGQDTFGFRLWGFGVGVMLLIIAIFVSLAIGQIDAGYRGTVLRFGAVTDKTEGEGFYVVMPFVNTIKRMDVQIHAYETPASAASKDLQDVNTKVTLNYKLDPAKVNTVYQDFRQDYVARIIVPAVQEGVKSITAQYEAAELITKRPKVKLDIEAVLRERLAHNGITLEAVSLTDFSFSAAFTQAIEAKQVAVQRAFQAENDLLRIEVEARQAKQSAEGRAAANIAEADGRRQAAILEAEGQKQAAILAAEGKAKATLTVADAQAKANQVVNSTLTEQVIRYALVQELGPDIRVVVLPSGQQFILGPEVLGSK